MAHAYFLLLLCSLSDESIINGPILTDIPRAARRRECADFVRKKSTEILAQATGHYRFWLVATIDIEILR